DLLSSADVLVGNSSSGIIEAPSLKVPTIGKTTRLQQLLAFLKSSDTVPFIMLDGSDDVRTQVNDWVREGLVKPENAFIWDRDFEDCFDDSLLAKAVEQITAVTGEQVNVAPEELAQARQEGKTVFSV